MNCYKTSAGYVGNHLISKHAAELLKARPSVWLNLVRNLCNSAIAYIRPVREKKGRRYGHCVATQCFAECFSVSGVLFPDKTKIKIQKYMYNYRGGCSVGQSRHAQ